MATDRTAPFDKQLIQRLTGYLLVASLAGYVAGILFDLALMKESNHPSDEPMKIAESLVYSIAGGVLLSGLAIVVGFRAGRRVGLGTFMLSGWDDGSCRALHGSLSSSRETK